MISKNFIATPKKIVLIFLLIFLGLISQISLFSNLFHGEYVPNFVVIVLIFLTFYLRSSLGLIIAWLIGACFDFFSSGLLGSGMLASLVIYFLFSIVANNFFINSRFIFAVSCFFGVAILTLVKLLVDAIFKINVELNSILLLKDMLATAIISPLIFLLMSRFFLESKNN